jgi:glycosyltransferase involved in cell wall biosynthesis
MTKRLVTLSVVVPTRNRSEDLVKLINSIKGQTTKPNEVIIVDDSDGNETERLAHGLEKILESRNISLKYLRGAGKHGSISAARNKGIDNAIGDLVFFVDDDVVLNERYIEQIMECYSRHPDAVGVQGYLPQLSNNLVTLRGCLINATNTVFSLWHLERGKCRILRSGNLTFPYDVKEDFVCSWLSGTDSSYKREILRFRFDEKLRAYSLWEDVDLSFRINRKFPNSLYTTPYAQLIHKRSPRARRPSRLLAYVRIAYHTYFFFKNLKPTLPNILAFIWSEIGHLLWCLKDPRELIFSFGAYAHTITHLREIIDGQFSFLDW